MGNLDQKLSTLRSERNHSRNFTVNSICVSFLCFDCFYYSYDNQCKYDVHDNHNCISFSSGCICFYLFVGTAAVAVQTSETLFALELLICAVTGFLFRRVLIICLDFVDISIFFEKILIKELIFSEICVIIRLWINMRFYHLQGKV